MFLTGIAILALFVFLALHFAPNEYKKECEVAAIVEYTPTRGKTLEETVWDNLHRYREIIDQKDFYNFDLIFFPRHRVGEAYSTKNKMELLEHEAIEIPSAGAGIIPHRYNNYSSILTNLSEAAQRNKVFVIVTLLEKIICAKSDENSKSCGSVNATVLHLTTVIFSKMGAVKMKFRDRILAMEDIFSAINSPKTPKIVYI